MSDLNPHSPNSTRSDTLDAVAFRTALGVVEPRDLRVHHMLWDPPQPVSPNPSPRHRHRLRAVLLSASFAHTLSHSFARFLFSLSLSDRLTHPAAAKSHPINRSGVHISKVRSTNLDTWRPEWIKVSAVQCSAVCSWMSVVLYIGRLARLGLATSLHLRPHLTDPSTRSLCGTVDANVGQSESQHAVGVPPQIRSTQGR
jgi:hypothetical protein